MHLCHFFQQPRPMQQFMWQPDLAGAAHFISESLALLQQELVQHESDSSPWWLEQIWQELGVGAWKDP